MSYRYVGLKNIGSAGCVHPDIVILMKQKRNVGHKAFAPKMAILYAVHDIDNPK